MIKRIAVGKERDGIFALKDGYDLPCKIRPQVSQVSGFAEMDLYCRNLVIKINRFNPGSFYKCVKLSEKAGSRFGFQVSKLDF